MRRFEFVEETGPYQYMAQLLEADGSCLRLTHDTLGGLKASVMRVLTGCSRAEIARVDQLFNVLACTIRDRPEDVSQIVDDPILEAYLDMKGAELMPDDE